jgi:hypothetical protein
MREYKKRLILTIEEAQTVDVAIELLGLMGEGNYLGLSLKG